MTYTLATLKTIIQDTTENNEATFVTHLTDFITNTEELIFKRVQLLLFKKNSTGSLTASDRYLAHPTDLLAPISLAVTDGASTRSSLDFKDVDFINMVYPLTSATGLPRYYSNFDIDNFVVAPTPDSNYALELTYYYRPASLTAGADDGTTWLSINAPMAMLYGALWHAYVYMKGEQDVLESYKGLFNEALIGLKQLGEAREVTDEIRTGRIRTPKQ